MKIFEEPILPILEAIITFFVYSLLGATPSQMEPLHKSLDNLFISAAIRGAVDIWPLLENHLVLELGSEAGSGSAGLSNCIRTDLRPIPGLDVVCDCMVLPFRDKVFDRTLAVYLAHHITDFKSLISEARRVSEKFYMFDFLPRSWLHYYSIVWDRLFFREIIRAAKPSHLRKIAPACRIYKRSHLGGVLYVF